MSDISQSELWNGEMGERWAAYSDALDNMLSPFTEPIMTAAALQPGERVVDIGCGAGVLSVRAAADVAPMGQVVGVDVSRPIVDVAEARFGERGDVAFEVTDASVWKPADLFDVLISRFGVMFFEDPVGGFQNLRAAIKPGGRMAFACWRTLPENDWAFALMKAVLPAIGAPPPPPPPGTPGPFAFGDETYLAGILAQSGWSGIEMSKFDSEIALPGETLEDMVNFAREMGPIARVLSENPANESSIIEHLLSFFKAQMSPDRRVRLPSAIWLVKANNA